MDIWQGMKQVFMGEPKCLMEFIKVLISGTIIDLLFSNRISNLKYHKMNSKIKLGIALTFGSLLFSGAGAFAQQTKKSSKKPTPVIRMFIGPKLENCEGSRPMKCMMVRKSEKQQWEYLYDDIKGFTYEEGYNYVVLVKKNPVKNPPADGSSIQIVLVKMVSKKKA